MRIPKMLVEKLMEQCGIGNRRYNILIQITSTLSVKEEGGKKELENGICSEEEGKINLEGRGELEAIINRRILLCNLQGQNSILK